MHSFRNNDVLLPNAYDVNVSPTAWGRCTHIFRMDYERTTMTSWWRSVVTFYLGCMVSEITRFYFKPDVTSSWFLCQGALHVIFWLPIQKGDPDFTLVLHCNYTFMFAGNDVIAISSLGGALGNFSLRILKGRKDMSRSTRAPTSSVNTVSTVQRSWI